MTDALRGSGKRKKVRRGWGCFRAVEINFLCWNYPIELRITVNRKLEVVASRGHVGLSFWLFVSLKGRGAEGSHPASAGQQTGAAALKSYGVRRSPEVFDLIQGSTSQ